VTEERHTSLNTVLGKDYYLARLRDIDKELAAHGRELDALRFVRDRLNLDIDKVLAACEALQRDRTDLQQDVIDLERLERAEALEDQS
jgi:hypothetical protein